MPENLRPNRSISWLFLLLALARACRLINCWLILKKASGNHSAQLRNAQPAKKPGCQRTAPLKATLKPCRRRLKRWARPIPMGRPKHRAGVIFSPPHRRLGLRRGSTALMCNNWLRRSRCAVLRPKHHVTPRWLRPMSTLKLRWPTAKKQPLRLLPPTPRSTAL